MKSNQKINFCNNDLNDNLFDLYKDSAYLAVDTEAMGLIHGRDRICLIQICNPSDAVACIRIHIGQQSAPNLKELLENKSIEKIKQ